MFSSYGKMIGLRGDYIAFCRKIRRVPFPIHIDGLGKVGTIAEVLNIHDNFVKGEMRDQFTEQVIQKAARPVILDCGVNVGITIRWWLHLNPNAQIYGVDMMAEAHEFTLNRLRHMKLDNQYTGITAVVCEVNNGETKINFVDPLNGLNSVTTIEPEGVVSASRFIKRQTIDNITTLNNINTVDLLKIDIEGYGAKALSGALKTLAFTKNVVLEIHSETELSISAKLLIETGFKARKFNSRNIWFTKE